MLRRFVFLCTTHFSSLSHLAVMVHTIPPLSLAFFLLFMKSKYALEAEGTRASVYVCAQDACFQSGLYWRL